MLAFILVFAPAIINHFLRSCVNKSAEWSDRALSEPVSVVCRTGSCERIVAPE